VVISATPIPGNEKAVSRVVNRLYKIGAIVIHKEVSGVHVSGHASAEELKLVLNLVRPANFMPIHGETRHLHAHADLARSVGMSDEDIFILENGRCLEIDEDGITLGEHVTSGVLYVDGLAVGDLGHVVLRDRQVLSSDGIVMVVVVVDTQNGSVVGETELLARGLVLGADTDDAIEDARARADKVLSRLSSEHVTDPAVIRQALRDSLSQYLWETTRRRPMIIPIVMEV